MYAVMYQMPSFCTSATCSVPAAGLSSRSRLRGTQGARLYTRRKFWAPAGLRGARSGRSKSRFLATSRGIAFRPARADHQALENPKNLDFFSLFFFTSFTSCFFRHHSSRQRLSSHGTTAALQAFSFVAATKGASACGFVSVRVCACVSW